MTARDANYPVIAGVGQLTNRPRSVEDAIEPVEMMTGVARTAERDAGVAGLLAQVDSVQVVNMLSWTYADAPGLLAARIGARPTHKVYSGIGGETPQRLVNETAAAIAETVQAVTKLRGSVTRVTEGSLPNDGKIIEDRRPIG